MTNQKAEVPDCRQCKKYLHINVGPRNCDECNAWPARPNDIDDKNYCSFCYARKVCETHPIEQEPANYCHKINTRSADWMAE
jgi:hypothetical protein